MCQHRKPPLEVLALRNCSSPATPRHLQGSAAHVKFDLPFRRRTAREQIASQKSPASRTCVSLLLRLGQVAGASVRTHSRFVSDHRLIMLSASSYVRTDHAPRICAEGDPGSDLPKLPMCLCSHTHCLLPSLRHADMPRHSQCGLIRLKKADHLAEHPDASQKGNSLTHRLPPPPPPHFKLEALHFPHRPHSLSGQWSGGWRRQAFLGFTNVWGKSGKLPPNKNSSEVTQGDKVANLSGH